MAPIKHIAHSVRKPHVEPAYVQVFIQQCLPAAREVKSKWRVPIAVLIAQAATESSWGRKAVDNAYFGVKGNMIADGSDVGSTTKFMTHEVLDGKRITVEGTFRAYQSFAEAADGYGEFLNVNPRYKAAFLYTGDPARFAIEVAKVHYASDPKLRGYSNQHHSVASPG